MPPQAKKMAGFLAMVVDATTTLQAEDYEDTDLRCHKRGCHGYIMAFIDQEESFIYYGYTDCNNEGRIDGFYQYCPKTLLFAMKYQGRRVDFNDLIRIFFHCHTVTVFIL